jgi:hypothetical protein
VAAGVAAEEPALSDRGATQQATLVAISLAGLNSRGDDPALASGSS